MHECASCGGEVGRSFRFCPWCAAPQRRKLVEFFPGHAAVEDSARRALRVSQYLEAEEPEGHVRFSVWDESATVIAALSLDRREAGRLAGFLGGPPPAPAEARSRAEHLLDSVRRRVGA